jgi:hypothetical protein
VQRQDSGLWSVSFTQPGLEAVATLKGLRRLRLNGTLISARGLETIKGLSQLEFLDLHDCAQISDDAIPILSVIGSLHFVDLTGTKISPTGLQQLRRTKPRCRILYSASSPRPKAETAER